jgi:peptidoglycan biosynthesis protein MviN/MurJ (putative lipid II flippase)
MLFRRGAFSHEAAAVTSRCFGLLLLFAPAGVVYMYLQRISYAVDDTLTPSLLQCAAQVLFVVCAPFVGARFGGDGLCLLLMTTQWIACALLAHWLSRSHGTLDFAGTAAFTSQLLMLSLVSAWAGIHAAQYFVWPQAGASGMLPLIFRMTLTSGFMAVVFVALTLMLRLPETFVWLRHLGTTGNSIVGLASCRKEIAGL